MLPYCVFFSALARPAAAEAPSVVQMLPPSPEAVKEATDSNTAGDIKPDASPLRLASLQPDVKSAPQQVQLAVCSGMGLQGKDSGKRWFLNRSPVRNCAWPPCPLPA